MNQQDLLAPAAPPVGQALARQPDSPPEKPADPRAAWSAPMWQAYVAQGATRADRAQRLTETPEALRDRVAGHVQTYFQIRAEKRHA